MAALAVPAIMEHHSATTLLVKRVEKPGGLHGFGFAKGDDCGQEGSHGLLLFVGDRTADELELSRHGGDKNLPRLEPSNQFGGFHRACRDSADQIVGVQANH